MVSRAQVTAVSLAMFFLKHVFSHSYNFQLSARIPLLSKVSGSHSSEQELRLALRLSWQEGWSGAAHTMVAAERARLVLFK